MQKRTIYKVEDYGVVPNRNEIQTISIQKCIDACRDNGGGIVHFSKGSYTIGSIRLYNNITLYLASGVELNGSKNLMDYQDFRVPSTISYLKDAYYVTKWHLPNYYFYGMITAFQAENIQIIGEPGSVINGQDVLDKNGEEGFRGPMGIVMSQVTNVKLSVYQFKKSANWSHVLDGCNQVEISETTITAGHDGYNLHHSKNITIQNSRFETGDDCLAGYDITNLVVKNCYLNTACNSLRLGGEQIRMIDCTFTGPGRYPHLSEDTYYTHGLFKYYSMDADSLLTNKESIEFENCKINQVGKLFSYDYGKKELMQNNHPLKRIVLKDMTIANITETSIVKGNGEPIQLTFDQVKFTEITATPFLEIDESTSIELINVMFTEPVTIEQLGKEPLVLEKNVTRLVNAQQEEHK
ncbi:hypothetical protein IGI37_002657 [Enterococcus sp. AZ194]|uniref:glycosyl hydrolase family 28 protein n=1 Tax=Enterococcus sp. AZ194 TaxID=2774629 RepID=UPI003F1ED671